MSGKKRRTKKIYPKPALPEDNLARWDRCVYCGKPVSPEAPPAVAQGRTRRFPACGVPCKEAAEDYVQADQKRKLGLYLILMVCAILILISALGGWQGPLTYTAILLAGIGFAAFPYPITTFETFQSCPIRRVTQITRILGTVLILLALIFIFLA
ncbi:hypothetical protein AALA54_04220 [Oscillospiraceae bacterium 44-34]